MLMARKGHGEAEISHQSKLICLTGWLFSGNRQKKVQHKTPGQIVHAKSMLRGLAASAAQSSPRLEAA